MANGAGAFAIRARTRATGGHSGICFKRARAARASSGGDGYRSAFAGGIKFGSIEVAEVRFPYFRHNSADPAATDGSAVGWRLARSGDGDRKAARGNTAGDGVRYGP